MLLIDELFLSPEPRYDVSTTPRTHALSAPDITASSTRSPTTTLDRRQRDLEATRRKQQLVRIQSFNNLIIIVFSILIISH